MTILFVFPKLQDTILLKSVILNEKVLIDNVTSLFVKFEMKKTSYIMTGSIFNVIRALDIEQIICWNICHLVDGHYSSK